MSYIKGIFKQTIFRKEETGYIIGLFRVKDSDIEDFINKTITFTGYFHNLLEEDIYTFNGNVVNHEKYGKQFNVENYEKSLPEEKDGVIEFLSSNIFKGIGTSTAKKIVDVLGKNTFDIIINNPDNLLLIPGITSKQIKTLHDSLNTYQGSYEIIVKLNELGFSTKESMLIYKRYKDRTKSIIEENIYKLYEDIDKITFKKIDYIFLKQGFPRNDNRRIETGIIYALTEVTSLLGHSYYSINEIYNYTVRALNTDISNTDFMESLNNLVKNIKLILENDKYYLKSMYEAETNVVARIGYLVRKKDNIVKNLDKDIFELETLNNITYNEEQRKAIMDSILKNILVITGGPGTGKTTLVKGIVDLYRNVNKYDSRDLDKKLALLSPTGRASKRLTESTHVQASTIHRFLKWNKESNTFGVDEHNKSNVEFVIIDEFSMVDIYLFDSLLKGLKVDTKIILVGDNNQLPSVGPGEVLKNIIESKKIDVITLDRLYRQEDGSSIITLAYDINNNEISNSVFNNKDTFFIPCLPSNVKENIINISKDYLDTDYRKFQILAPMYKGLNGIDELNLKLQTLFNKKSPKKNEIIINDTVYREGDKVIQLTNRPDDNVFNGDIGIINSITSNNKKEVIIDFDNNYVTYTPSDFLNFKHAYAISIHKSQGSEFDYVIIPLVKSYSKMLYRKLIYTAVTRSKKKLYIVGDIDALYIAANNNDVDIRRTTLTEKLIEKV